MKKLKVVLLLLLASIYAPAARAQSSKYPPLSEYLMPQDAEIGLFSSRHPQYHP